MEIDVRKEAIKLYNETWDLLDIPAESRSDEQNLEMIHKTHASNYLWSLVGEPKNFARGEWQVSHVYAVLGCGELALKYGEASLKIVQESGIGGKDLAFGFEAVARAYAVMGDYDKAREYKAKGLEAASLLEDEDDRKYIEGELNGIVTLNPGQKMFFDFVMERVLEGKKADIQKIMAESFKRQADGTFTKEYMAETAPAIITLLRPECVEEFKQAAAHMSGQLQS
ncbi:MAG: tetratricopeptide repeat protein [Clostridiales bacterium]|nr:tetratricopeptide repeat protein [Clostridiales bacterium]